MRSLGREEDHVVSVQGKTALPRRLAQDALAAVAVHGIPKTLRRDEGDPCGVALVELSHSDAQERIVEPLPAREDLLKIALGFDGLHLLYLDGELLAALGAATGENLTAALGGHTGAETVGLGALALVGLIRTLHSYSSRLGVNVF